MKPLPEKAVKKSKATLVLELEEKLKSRYANTFLHAIDELVMFDMTQSLKTRYSKRTKTQIKGLVVMCSFTDRQVADLVVTSAKKHGLRAKILQSENDRKQ